MVKRRISSIARRSLKPKRLAELLGALSHYYRVGRALELGTSLGITSAYLGREIRKDLISFEGAQPVAEEAVRCWARLAIHNVDCRVGTFEALLDGLDQEDVFDLIFLDGHHQYEPSLMYFKRLLQYSAPGTVIVLDDIHWSPDMEKAWTEIVRHPQVTLCIDLFWIGLVFLRPELSKQCIQLRY